MPAVRPGPDILHAVAPDEVHETLKGTPCATEVSVIVTEAVAACATGEESVKKSASARRAYKAVVNAARVMAARSQHVIKLSLSPRERQRAASKFRQARNAFRRTIKQYRKHV